MGVKLVFDSFFTPFFYTFKGGSTRKEEEEDWQSEASYAVQPKIC